MHYWIDRIKALLKSTVANYAGWMVGGGGIQTAVAFFGNIVLVWLLNPEDFGRFAVVQANIGIVTALVDFKLAEVILKLQQKELRAHWNAIATFQLIQTLLIVFIAGTVLWVQGLLVTGSVILLVGGLVAPWVSLYTKLYERSFKYKNISLFESGSQASAHILAMLGAAMGLGPIVLYGRELLRVTGRFIGLIYFDAVKHFSVQLIDYKDLAFIYKKSRGFWADGVVERSFDRLVILSLESLAGEEATGYFFQAKKIAITPHKLINPLTSRIAYNYFSHRIKDQKTSALLKVVVVEAALLSLVSVGILFFADPLIPWIFGERWIPVVGLLHALVGYIVGIVLFGTVKYYCMANDKLRILVVLGRGIQYFALITGIGIALMFGVGPELAITVALSVGYMVGVSAVLTALWIDSDHSRCVLR